MNAPLVSVVIETITRYDYPNAALADDLKRVLSAVDRQNYPQDRIEVIVVLDESVEAQMADELRLRHPGVTFAFSARNYFAAKNAGVMLSRGSIVALLDGDCEPGPEWLKALVSRFEPDVAAVAGETRYTGKSLIARTFSVSDFAHVVAGDSGDASGFNINNVAFRREVLLAHPFDSRLRRNGGCYFLYHQLRGAGLRIVYEPSAQVGHGLDVQGLGFLRKHFERGYDGVSVYRLDDAGVLRGTRLFKRFGAAALIAMTGRRILLDWVRLARKRRQAGISLVTLPYFLALMVGTRLIELTGALVAVIARRPALAS